MKTKTPGLVYKTFGNSRQSIDREHKSFISGQHRVSLFFPESRFVTNLDPCQVTMVLRSFIERVILVGVFAVAPPGFRRARKQECSEQKPSDAPGRFSVPALPWYRLERKQELTGDTMSSPRGDPR